MGTLHSSLSQNVSFKMVGLDIAHDCGDYLDLAAWMVGIQKKIGGEFSP